MTLEGSSQPVLLAGDASGACKASILTPEMLEPLQSQAQAPEIHAPVCTLIAPDSRGVTSLAARIAGGIFLCIPSLLPVKQF